METKIQELRKANKISQAELADEMGVTRQTIISLEKGRYNASLELAFKIARYFGQTIEEVFNWRRLVAIASLNLVIFFLGDLLGYFVGQLTHNAAMENQAALNKIFIHVPFYLYLVVAGFIIPIMEEIIFRGLLAKVLFGKYFKTGLVISSLLFMAGHSAFTPQTIVVYGIMSAGLAITYYKTKHIEYSMGVHILNNSIAVLLSLFV